MLKSVTNLITGGGDRVLKRLQPDVESVASWETELERLSDEELRAKTDEFRALLAKGEYLDDIRSEAFAVVREASKRAIGLRHF